MSALTQPPAKRARGGTSLGAVDDNSGSDGEGGGGGGGGSSSRPGPAARKRNLERQRRNLVSTRFLELDRVLADDNPDDEKRHAHQPSRRIDKEAILKDAATRITSVSEDLVAAQKRIAAMTVEAENLRAEKVELRADKTYLHTELNIVRTEVQRLRGDNIHLWQAIRRSGGLKSALSADVAKIPADILLRAPNASLANFQLQQERANSQQHQHQYHVPSPASVPSTGEPRDQSRETLRRSPSLPMQHDQRFFGDGKPTGVDPPNAPEQRAGQQTSTLHSSAQLSISLQNSASLPPMPTSVRDPTGEASLVDSFLVFQSPEELGELFSDCPVGLPSQSLQPQLANSNAAVHHHPQVGQHGTSNHQRQDGSVSTLPQPEESPAALAQGLSLGAPPETEGIGEKGEDDFLDVAYCA